MNLMVATRIVLGKRKVIIHSMLLKDVLTKMACCFAGSICIIILVASIIAPGTRAVG